MVGSAAFRRCALSLLKACSIGLRSGGYLGRYRSFASASSITSRPVATLWTGRNETFFEVGYKGRCIHRSIKYQGRDHRAPAQAGNKGDGLPVAVRHMVD